MARCGCSGSGCSCVVQGSGGISVTGSGTAANPFVVSGGGVVTVQDTATIDLTLTGAGSGGSPYVLKADAQINVMELADTAGTAATGQVLAKQADGFWRPVAAPSAAPGVINTINGVQGDGSAGTPLQVKLQTNSGLVQGSTGLALEGATWSAFTVALTASGSAPVIGNGVVSGRYVKRGTTVQARVYIKIGSTTQRGSGMWGFSLPLAARNDASLQVGVAHMGVFNGGRFVGTFLAEPGSTAVSRLYFNSGSGETAVSHSWPVSLPAGSELIFQITYETD